MVVCLGSTLSYGMPAFSALYSRMFPREDHRCSDIFLENLFDLSMPATLRSSVAMPSWVWTKRCARRKSAWTARSFSLRCALTRERAFFPLLREPLLALENLRWALLIGEASIFLGGTTEPSESVRRCVRPTSIPTGLEGSTCGISLSGCLTTTWISVRRGVRTTRSSFTLAPPPRAMPRRCPLSLNFRLGSPFIPSLHHTEDAPSVPGGGGPP